MKKKNSNVSGIVLLAKQSGLTSFSSLTQVKKALGTSKVGHTGTLDSFAQGLLVVCVGSLTRLASHITSFNKTYEAVIEFGKETDTLEPSGAVIKTAPLPTLENLNEALKKFTGELMQIPPQFSALHVGGERASDLIRKGISVELKARPVTVYESQILETVIEDGKVHYARIRFSVSKGTYIRSLARDIALECKSAGYLTGLLRTKISSFDLKDAAGVEYLEPFTISSVLKNQNKTEENHFDFEKLFDPIKEKLMPMTPLVAEECGLKNIQLKKENEFDFYNGRPLRKNYFTLDEKFENRKYAVFLSDSTFAGVINIEEKRISYEYVIPRNAENMV